MRGLSLLLLLLLLLLLSIFAILYYKKNRYTIFYSNRIKVLTKVEMALAHDAYHPHITYVTI